MDNTLKLYVWKDIMCDYTCGIAFALAHSVEEARDILVNTPGQERYLSDYLAREISGDPEVFDTPCAFSVSGGG